MTQTEVVKEETTVDRIPGTSLPKLSYHAALNSWFRLGENVFQVRSCDSMIFLIFCSIISMGMEKTTTRCALLIMLDEQDSDETRWYLLENLKRSKVTMSLYRTAEEAYRVHNASETHYDEQQTAY